ncbi:hypothetical protein A1Q2_07394 [Trichosporon asahii var. asahii CBS 8904]|uniref:Vps52 C-terminal domain-containing protein n=1 Tax=Trichosporon asahii var. asahii (strain CBS 8904) TaxID=1220162 RepID=K1VC38_TRIAC|nr:hypothetical protein A1Q2_07394 [Trichosporon asahii var. asahii CBS 8904]
MQKEVSFTDDHSADSQGALETPGAGPSRPPSPPALPEPLLDEADEDADRELCKRSTLIWRARSSAELLTSLGSYLETFQDNLSEVSGQIADLQQRSDEIERQLKGRRNPQLWLQAVQELEEKLVSVKARGAKVKAARELEGVLEALALKAMHALPPFLLTLIRPLRSASKGLSTNLAVMQTSLLLKYQPFYSFLLRQSPRHAKQVERGYVNAARSYYETAMRRYARALSTIRARTPEKSELIGVVPAEEAAAPVDRTPPSAKQTYGKLKIAELNMEDDEGAVVLAYTMDNKETTAPVEQLFRSLGLVLLDNGSAEFTFIVRFFARAGLGSGSSTPKPPNVRSPNSTPLDSPVLGPMSDAGKSRGGRRRGNAAAASAESLKDAERIWNEVFGSALEYTTQFFQTIVTTPPSAASLLTIIRLNDELIKTTESRGALPLIPYLTGWKLALWPVYRKAMDAHIDSIKALADQAEGKGLTSWVSKAVKDSQVRHVALRYAVLFSMLRMRNELIRLIKIQGDKIKDVPARQSFLSSTYEIVMRELVAGPGAPTNAHLQSELSFFRTREEEARRRISVT